MHLSHQMKLCFSSKLIPSWVALVNDRSLHYGPPRHPVSTGATYNQESKTPFHGLFKLISSSKLLLIAFCILDAPPPIL